MLKPRSLLFVIPLKSKESSRNWKQTSMFLEATLKCIEGQTSRAFHALLVCNELPTLRNEYPNVTFLETDIRIDGEFSFAKARLDKQRKILHGLLHARALEPDRAMVVDSDDLIHRDLVRYAESRSTDGLVINRGYRLQLSKKKLRKSRNYHVISGSSIMFPYRATDLPEALTDKDVDRHYMSQMAHPKPIEKIFANNGFTFEYIPFYAGIYVRGHDDSIRDHFQPVANPNATPLKNLGRIGKRVNSGGWKLFGRLLGTRRINRDVEADFPGLADYAASRAHIPGRRLLETTSLIKKTQER